MPLQSQKQIPISDEEIITRYNMMSMPISGNVPGSLTYGMPVDGMVELPARNPKYNWEPAPYQPGEVMAGQQYSGKSWSTDPKSPKGKEMQEQARGSGTVQVERSEISPGDGKKVLARGPERSPIDDLYSNMQSDQVESKLATERGFGLMSGIDPNAKMEAAQIAFDSASSADVAEAKQVVHKMERGDQETVRKDPNDMSMGERLAMIAMAIAPVIAGYAMYGEKGAYIGGIAGMKGIEKTADNMWNRESQQLAQASKERIAGVKAEGKDSANKPVDKFVGWNPEANRWERTHVDKAGKITFSGVEVPTPMVKNPVTGEMEQAKPPRSSAPTQTTGYVQTTKQQTPPPAGVRGPGPLPGPSPKRTMKYYDEQFTALTGRQDPFFEPYMDMSYDEFVSTLSKDPAGKVKLDEFKDLRGVIEKRDALLAKAKTQQDIAKINNDARIALEDRKFGQKKELEGIRAKLRQETAKAIADHKAHLAKVKATKDPKVLRDMYEADAVKYGNDTADFLNKAGNINSLTDSKDPTQVAGVFFGFMKLVQQDNSVVRESDMEVVNKFTPLITQGEGAFEKYLRDNPGIASEGG